MGKKRVGAAALRREDARMEACGIVDVPGLAITGDTKRWIVTSMGKMSVAEACEKNLKTTVRGQAVEARDRDVTEFLIYKNMDVLQTAATAGWDVPKYLGEMRFPRLRKEDVTIAVNYILQRVDAGETVRLFPTAGVCQTIHLHNTGKGGRKIRAAFVPCWLMLTQNVHCAKNNAWINSRSPGSKRMLKSKFPYAWVGKKGFGIKKRSRWWPQLASSRCWGHTGMKQLGSLFVEYKRVQQR